MKLLIDMNLSPDWEKILTDAGHDALHWSKVGLPTASDRDILRWARTDDRVILTSDLDFGTLLATSGARRPSVVQLRVGTTLPSRIGDMVTRVLSQTEPDLSAGALVTVEHDRLRVRPLIFAASIKS